jgi:hypothetical protein
VHVAPLRPQDLNTQEKKIPHIEHMLNIGILSCAAHTIVQGVTQIEDADQSTITASKTHKTQDKTKCTKAHINQGVNCPV